MRRSRALPAAFVALAAVLFALTAAGSLPGPVGLITGAAALGAAVAVGALALRRPGTGAPALAVESNAPAAAPAAPLGSGVTANEDTVVANVDTGGATIIDLRDRPAATEAAKAPSEVEDANADTDAVIRRIPSVAKSRKAAPASPESPTVELTAAGLERRRTGPQKPQGSTAQPAAPPGAAPGRSAEEVRSMLQRYRSGVSAGRDKLDNPDQRPLP